MPQMCHSNMCWALLSVGSQVPAFGDDGKGSWKEALGKGNHPHCSAGWVLASTQGVYCQKQKGLGILLPTRGRQGAASLTARSLCPLEDLPLQHFPSHSLLEQSQLHKEGTGIGATVSDSHSQHVSERAAQRRAPVFQQCSWHSLLRALEVLHTPSAPRAGHCQSV